MQGSMRLAAWKLPSKVQAWIRKGGLFQICGLFKSVDGNKHEIKSVLPLCAVIIGPQLLYTLDHAYFALISVLGLKINHGLEINHLCEFGPKCFNMTQALPKMFQVFMHLWEYLLNCLWTFIYHIFIYLYILFKKNIWVRCSSLWFLLSKLAMDEILTINYMKEFQEPL